MPQLPALLTTRMRRSKFFWYVMMVGAALGVTHAVFAPRLSAAQSADIFAFVAGAPILVTLVDLAGTIALLLLAGPRLRDLNLSPWWALAFPVLGIVSQLAGDPVRTALAPGGFVGLFALLFVPGTEGPNRFGPDPLPAVEEAKDSESDQPST